MNKGTCHNTKRWLVTLALLLSLLGAVLTQATDPPVHVSDEAPAIAGPIGGNGNG